MAERADERRHHQRATVVSPMSASEGTVVFLSFDGRTLQIIPYDMRSTFRSALAPRNSAKSADDRAR